MKEIAVLAAALALTAASFGGTKPLATAIHYDGKFKWIKLEGVPSSAIQSLSTAKSLLVELSFPREVRLRKDKGGNQWFTFIVADQGSDWKWHQTSHPTGVPLSGGSVKPGSYTISIPLSGIPTSVLKDKQQTISLGAAASGLSAPATFSFLSVRGG